MSRSSIPTEAEGPPLTLPPIHPGENLAVEIEELGISASALARVLDVPANRVTGVVNGKRAITADTALRLARYFGTSARFWMNLQQSYDLALAERELGPAITKAVRPCAA